MKSLVKHHAGPGFQLMDVPVPSILDNEVLIRVRRAGVCGTDVHIYEWDDWARGRCKPPFVVGHEFAGDVVEVGKLVTDVTQLYDEYGFGEARELVERKLAGERVALPADLQEKWRGQAERAFTLLDETRARSPLPEETPNRAELEAWLLEVRRRYFF